MSRGDRLAQVIRIEAGENQQMDIEKTPSAAARQSKAPAAESATRPSCDHTPARTAGQRPEMPTPPGHQDPAAEIQPATGKAELTDRPEAQCGNPHGDQQRHHDQEQHIVLARRFAAAGCAGGSGLHGTRAVPACRQRLGRHGVPRIFVILDSGRAINAMTGGNDASPDDAGSTTGWISSRHGDTNHHSQTNSPGLRTPACGQTTSPANSREADGGNHHSFHTGREQCYARRQSGPACYRPSAWRWPARPVRHHRHRSAFGVPYAVHGGATTWGPQKAWDSSAQMFCCKCSSSVTEHHLESGILAHDADGPEWAGAVQEIRL